MGLIKKNKIKMRRDWGHASYYSGITLLISSSDNTFLKNIQKYKTPFWFDIYLW